MQLPMLQIGTLKAKIPIIQGGMAVRISTAPLAAAVANEGGIGVIAGTGMSVAELREEIKRARRLSKGIIGVNVMFAVREFANLVIAALEEGIDLVISGAGFSRDIFGWGKKYNRAIVPIVSTPRLAMMAERLGASAVVVEGVEAGGHLGTKEQLKNIISSVRNTIKIPIIAAGGITTGKDIVEALKLGANGVQMGTKFAASEESNASQAFKNLYLSAKETDLVFVQSPVGLEGRAIRNEFIRALEAKKPLKPWRCENCLKECSRKFCILSALENAQKGNLEEGLVFAGTGVTGITQILPVKKIISSLLTEVNEYLKKGEDSF
ncbi:MAG: nitronate monooxygenase [Bacillota bacterium]